jgi:hypothetical protein
VPCGHIACKADLAFGYINETRRNQMKKILLGLVAGLSLLAFTVPAHAEGDAAGGDKPADAKPAKKSKKKSKKGEGDAAGGDAAGGAAPAGDKK